MERTKMPTLRNGSKGGFEHGLTWLRVRRSTAEIRAPWRHFIDTRTAIVRVSSSKRDRVDRIRALGLRLYTVRKKAFDCTHVARKFQLQTPFGRHRCPRSSRLRPTSPLSITRRCLYRIQSNRCTCSTPCSCRCTTRRISATIRHTCIGERRHVGPLKDTGHAHCKCRHCMHSRYCIHIRRTWRFGCNRQLFID